MKRMTSFTMIIALVLSMLVGALDAGAHGMREV